MANKFAEANGARPTIWLRGQPPRRLKQDISLALAGVLPELVVELVVTFASVRTLPTRIAGTVPDPASGRPLRPPGAFMVMEMLYLCSPGTQYTQLQ